MSKNTHYLTDCSKYSNNEYANVLLSLVYYLLYNLLAVFQYTCNVFKIIYSAYRNLFKEIQEQELVYNIVISYLTYRYLKAD